ncbi:MAG: lysine--tRNA ligase [Dehalococcoidia bacterium]|nr:lysine--tRNA ligase [Dehalococcoidia bacterium]MCB9486842.1 lysine--tRNA ligase [Thermoflexaceae bacterium]
MDELMAQRARKIEEFRARGVDPYPPRVTRTHTAAEAVAAVEALPEGAGEADAGSVHVAGRVVARREMGKATFVDLQDASGRLQVLLRQNAVGPDDYSLFGLVDLGDYVGFEGTPMRTRTGQPTVGATSWVMLAKALHAPPEKYHGLADAEIRQRRRYLDLIANEQTREVFRIRSKAVAAIRRFLDSRDFLEVETPVLQEAAGGAAARPFVTHFNALEEDRFLRISLELHLKRLVVGGFDRVYELGRIFRNEGLGFRWNPEFTMLETYEAYSDYNGVADMVETMVSSVAQEVLGRTTVTWRDHEIDLAPPWHRLTMRDALLDHSGIDLFEVRTEAAMRTELTRRGVTAAPTSGYGKLVDEAVSHFVEPHLIQPTFLLDYPVELSPLAKRKPEDPRFVERFEVFIGGFELGNAYTELNDPIEQRARFEEQVRLKAAGDDEAELMDEDFLFALEHGMPPCGGFGMGIDRLVMVLTGQASIREVILFPQLRSQKG